MTRTLLADIMQGHHDLADWLFLLAVILGVVAAILAAPRASSSTTTTPPRASAAVWVTTVLALAVAAIAFGLLAL